MISTLIAALVLQTQSWEPLFDGRTTAGWKGWRKDAMPNGWSVEDGSLKFTPGKERGDICTVGEYGDFDLRLEWKVQPGGNSGIFYRASEHLAVPWQTAPEYQVLDDFLHSDGKKPLSRAAACYAMYPASSSVARGGGKWNSARIVARGRQIEHWLNGVRVVRYEIGSPDWRERFAKSGYRDQKEYGSLAQGKFVLQDHGDHVWYRNIRLKRL